MSRTKKGRDFRVIQGKFQIYGYQPDGDSIRFEAKDCKDWKHVKKSIEFKKGLVQLRLEAIDTLETHYKGKKQPPEFADKATKKLLGLIGFQDVEWNESKSRVISHRGVELDGTIISLYW